MSLIGAALLCAGLFGCGGPQDVAETGTSAAGIASNCGTNSEIAQGSISVSASTNGANAYKILDASTSTYWVGAATQATTHEVVLDLGAVTYDLDSVEFQGLTSSWPFFYNNKHTISISDDGTNYSTIATNVSYALYGATTIVDLGLASARYIKFRSGNTSGWGAIAPHYAEIRVYECP